MRPSDICYLCGTQLKDENRTMDHVPPKSLFVRPFPPNLITVPCCKNCNGNKSRDEDFFRLIATLGLDRPPETEALYSQRTLPNSISKHRLKAEIQELIASMEHHWMERNGIISLTPTFRVPMSRIKKVAENIGKGLTAHFNPETEVHRLHCCTYIPNRDQLLEVFASLCDDLTELRIGGRAFHAWHGTTVGNKAVGIWLMTFHERIPVAFVHYDDAFAELMVRPPE